MEAFSSTNLTKFNISEEMDYKNWTNCTSKENTTLPFRGLGGGRFWWYQNTDLYYYAYKTWYYSFIVTFSIGIPVNVLIFITMLSSEKLRRNSSGMLIIYLAMWEFVDSVIRISDWFLSYMPCVLFDYILYVPQFIANTSMFLISLNRYALVCHSFSHQHTGTLLCSSYSKNIRRKSKNMQN